MVPTYPEEVAWNHLHHKLQLSTTCVDLEGTVLRERSRTNIAWFRSRVESTKQDKRISKAEAENKPMAAGERMGGGGMGKTGEGGQEGTGPQVWND